MLFQIFTFTRFHNVRLQINTLSSAHEAQLLEISQKATEVQKNHDTSCRKLIADAKLAQQQNDDKIEELNARHSREIIMGLSQKLLAVASLKATYSSEMDRMQKTHDNELNCKVL